MPKKVAPIVGIFNDDGSVHSLAQDGLGVAGPLTDLGATAPTLAGMQTAFNDGSAAEKSAFQSSVSGDGSRRISLSGRNKYPIGRRAAVMSNPPTLTVQIGGASAIASPRSIAASDPAFFYVQPVIDWPPNPACKARTDVSLPLSVKFWTDAAILEIKLIRYNTRVNCRVDGQPVQQLAEVLSSAGDAAFWRITFPTSTPRFFELDGFNFPFTGVNIGPNDSIYAPDDFGGAAVTWSFGDSYTQGTGADCVRDTVAGVICDALGRIHCPDGIGGSGYNSTSPTLLSRVIAALQSAPYCDEVNFLLGYNDKNGDMVALKANAIAAYNKVRELKPNAKINVFGPWRPNGGSAALDTVEATILDAVNAANAADANLRATFISTAWMADALAWPKITADIDHVNQFGHTMWGLRCAQKMVLAGVA